MKIKGIEIANFGQLSNYNLDFEDGFQVMFGKNEEGKSTLMAFILLMFYGDHGRSRNLEQMPRQLYMPWGGGAMEGAMEIEHKGTRYRLQKIFGDTPSKDKVTLVNLDSGDTLPLSRGEEVGQYFFGLNLQSYKRSSFISQAGGFDSSKETDFIAERLISNLVNTGDEDISQREVLTRLENAKYALVSKRGDRGSLTVKESQLKALMEEKEELRDILGSQKELQNSYNETREKLGRLEELEIELEKLNLLKEKANTEQLVVYKKRIGELEVNFQERGFLEQEAEAVSTEGSVIIANHSKQREALRELKKSAETHVEISEAEYEEYTSLKKKNSVIYGIVNRNKASLFPFYKSYTDLGKTSESLQRELEVLREHYMQNLQPKEQKLSGLKITKVEKEQEKGYKVENINQRFALWNEERELKQRELAVLREQVTNTKVSSKPNLILLVLGILVLVASVVGGFFINPIIMFGVVAGLGLIVLGVLKKTHINMDIRAELEEKLDATIEQTAKWDGEIKDKQAELEKDLLEINELLEGVDSEMEGLETEFEYEEFKVAGERLQNSGNLVKNAQFAAETAKENFENLREEILKELREENIRIDSTKEDLTEALESALNRHARLLAELMFSKNVKLPERFEAEYLNSQGALKNLEVIKNMENNLSHTENELLKLLSDHKLYLDFIQGTAFVQRLKVNLEELRTTRKEVQILLSASHMDEPSVGELEGKLRAIAETKSRYELEQLPSLETEQRELKGENLVNRLGELQKQLHSPKRMMEQIEQEIGEAKEQHEQLELHYHGVTMALELMEESAEELRQSFGTVVNERTGEIFRALTQEKYTNILVNKNYDIQFKSGIHYREWQYLSGGTIDQAYLALRLAVSELISDDDVHMPIFIDDMLMQYDDERAQNALNYLNEYSRDKGAQTVLFTCHGRIVDYAKNSQIPVETIRRNE